MMTLQRTFKGMVFAVVGLGIAAAPQDKPSVVTMAASKFATPAGFPPCITTAVQHGDPTKGPSVILTKLTRGCFTPWHWHTTNEGGVMLSGRIKLEVKGETPKYLVTGDYFYNPSKHAHQTTCIAACIISTTSDSARDIHYVDKGGKEISAEEALKLSSKPVK
jgi:quercetin dioxygenase-like cupin family protein